MYWDDYSDHVVVYEEFKDIKVENINSTEICILQIYKDMFGKNYNPQVDEKHLQKRHIAVQNLANLFQIHNFYIQDYAFLWDKIYDKPGPTSQALERALKKLDKKPNDIARFYEIDVEIIKQAIFTDYEARAYPDLMEILKSNRPEGCSLSTWLDAIALIEYFEHTGIYGYKHITDAVIRNRPNINKDILPYAWQTKEAFINYNYKEYHKNDVNNKL